MEYKNIDNFDPSLYAAYAISSILEDFHIYTVHPSGLKEHTHYDTYILDNKCLIAFTKIHLLKTDFVYRIVSENFTEELNAETYESLEDLLTEDYDKENHTFILHNSVGNLSELNHGEWLGSAIDPKRRCDIVDDHYISVPFLDSNKENAPDILDRNHLGNNNVIGWQLVLASMSNLYVAKLTHGAMNDRAYKDWPGRVFVSQTFPHIIKMAYQWAILANDPWNSNDTIAIKCKKAFEDWNIQEDAIKELIDSQPNTVLELYFNNDENPRKSISEPTTLTPKFKKWFMSRLRYRTLLSLKENYPEEIKIPQSMIDKEIYFFENVVYDFIIENGLDPESTKSVDILEIVYSGAYKDEKLKNNSVDDIILKYFSRQDNEEKELVKKFFKKNTKPMDYSEEVLKDK